ncbi:SusC/RagA family TonB-linked outer membrane protein [Persicitalea jodogahamensis]|uniref:SusC/RagA family TonB-linked outer membrane protein n=1 Tax=Persicitalea jodogahamensis TaxID=402147 RepID=A0A8J3GAX3_9BACT|nr:TonB-dependent receptor [Persicitalea jodogahamensis]GHB77687.1 SusC/RagA family TonB-linked outer membrane protein [Persicitalea jodogahamensis]
MNKKIQFIISAGLFLGMAQPMQAQLLAKATNLNRAQGSTQTRMIKLKDALAELKKIHKVDILFFGKNIEHYEVPARQYRPSQSVEHDLEQLLEPMNLNFKKSGKGGYVITEKRVEQKSSPDRKETSGAEPSQQADQSELPANSIQLLARREVSAEVAEISVSGKITASDNNEPLPGVSVLVKGTSQGTTTNQSGEYTVSVPNSSAVLVFSFVGYVSQEVPVGGQTRINLSLQPDTKALSEVVVVGYGTQRKSDLTGSVASIGEKDFTQGVNNSALQLLNGRASGVQISQSSSAPGGGIAIRIRGAGSINSSNEPLIVIDGFPGATTTSISPEDIESIQILKDASAAAIYGSRAANGVVLITTKKGKAGTPRVNYSAYLGVQTVAKRMDLLNTEQYIEVLNDLSVEQTGKPKFTPDQINGIGSGTDWQDQIFRTALAQNHQLSFSGGSDKSNYYMGLNYLNQDGVVLGSGLKKYNIRLNYQVNPTDKLKVSLNLNANRSATTNILTTNSGNENAGPINGALQFDPTISPEKDENGQYRFNPLISLENPLALINGFTQKYVNNRTFGTLAADYTILKGWTTTLRLGGDIANDRRDSYNSTITQKGLSSGGIGSINAGEDTHWISELFTTYNHTFNGIHQLSILGGATLEKYDNTDVGASSIGFLSDASLTNLLQSGDGDRGDNVSSGRSTNQLNSYLGRVNYTLKDKYLLTASIRADGTSRFSDTNKYAIFPSFALGWRVSEESFLQNNNLFSDLKLRMSYGQSGNQAIGNFQTLTTFIAGGRAVLGGGLVQGVEPARIPNPDLRWETTEELDLGLDFAIINGRVSGSLEYYIKSTRDQLFNKPLPTTSGFGSLLVNFGKVRNQGIDLMLESRNLVNDFKWNTNFTFSTLKNTVVELPDFISQVLTGGVGFTGNYAIVQEGSAMRSFYGYQVDGIYQTADEVKNSPSPTFKPGYPRFVDQNGDGKITPDDRVILGSPFPKLLFGLNNSFSYRGFNLEALITAVQGISALDNNIVESLYPINFDRNRIAEHYLDRWTPDNPGAQYPSGVNPSVYGGALAVNSLTINDASFVRLKTVSLSYAIPVSKKIRSASVYVAADNLLTITKFLGFDPDANASGTGIERASYNSYPLNRTVRFGVNLGF